MLAACSTKQKSTEKYFDFDGLVDKQISELSQRKRVLDKTAHVNGNISDTTMVPDTQGWEAELDLFRQLEILNKPIHHDAYKVIGPLKDPKSNLKVRLFDAGSPSIPIIKIYYLSEFSRIRKVEASISESNILYSSGRFMTMEFEEEDGKPLLTRYGVNGFQKLLMGDTVKFSVEGQVDW